MREGIEDKKKESKKKKNNNNNKSKIFTLNFLDCDMY